MTETFAPLTSMLAGVACRGWFSERPHDEPTWIRIEDGVIAAMSPTQPPSGDYRQIGDASLYAVPLLADTHVHVYMEPWPVSPADRKPPGSELFETEVANAMRRVDGALAHGIGLLRDMGDPHGINLETKRRRAAQGLTAPELIVPGPAFHRPGRYGRLLGVERRTVADIVNSIDALHDRGEIDYLKVVTTGIVDFVERRVKQPPQFTVDELSQVVAHAHARGYKVASHCSGQDGIDVNLAAGVDFIEHGYFVSEDQIDRLVQSGVAWTPTFAPVHVQSAHAGCGWSDDVRRTIEALLGAHVTRVAYAASLGTTILAGTDAGCPGVSMGTGVRMELQWLAAAGVSADRLLHMATVGNAQALGAKGYTPTIATGRPASFALYEKCPWHDIRHLDTLKHVIVAGRRVVSQDSFSPCFT
jgi:imidazolonepropionase-like amidohydrolase